MSKTKRCSKCGKIQSLDCFTKDKQYKDGLQCTCKKCRNKSLRNYRHTKIGLAYTIHQQQVARSKNRKYNLPTYTKEELKEWLFDQPLFHKLYDNWVKSDYDKWDRPSVDRLDDYNSYSFDNIQLVTWQENFNKGHKYMKNGKNNKQSKSVLQYDFDGNFIREYYSIASASRINKVCRVNIVATCNGRKRSAGGYIWKYKNE